MKYSEIRKYSPIAGKGLFVSEVLCMLLSPYLTSIFIKQKVTPNTVTLLMIILSIIGTILLVIPSLVLMLLSIICLWGWFVLDCSDGEVARITQNFSKYGREMDYMAHLICHPLLNLSIFIFYYQRGYDLLILALISISFISLELVNRSIIVINIYRSSMCYGEILKTNYFKYVIQQFLYYPNFVLFFPIIMLIGEITGSNSFLLYVCWFSIYLLYCLKQIVTTLYTFYKS